MIDKMRFVAQKMQWVKPIAIVAAFCAVGLIGYIVSADSGIATDDRYLYPSVLLLLWSFSVLGFIRTFVHVPDASDGSLGFFRRIGRALVRFYYYLLSFVMLGLTIGVVFASIRALRL